MARVSDSALLSAVDSGFGLIGAFALVGGVFKDSSSFLHESHFLERRFPRFVDRAGRFSTFPLFKATPYFAIGSMAHTALRTGFRLLDSQDRLGDSLLLGGIVSGLVSFIPTLNPQIRSGLVLIGLGADLANLTLIGFGKRSEVPTPQLLIQTGLLLLSARGFRNWFDPNRLLREIHNEFPDAALFKGGGSTVVSHRPGARITTRELARFVMKRTSGLSRMVSDDVQMGGVMAPFGETGYFTLREGSHDSALALREIVRRAKAQGIDLARDAQWWDRRYGWEFKERFGYLDHYITALPLTHRVSSRKIRGLFEHYFPGSKRLWLRSEEATAAALEDVRSRNSTTPAGHRRNSIDFELPTDVPSLLALLRRKLDHVFSNISFETARAGGDTIRIFQGDRVHGGTGREIRRLFLLTDDLERIGFEILMPHEREKVRLSLELLDQLKVSRKTPPPITY